MGGVSCALRHGRGKVNVLCKKKIGVKDGGHKSG